MSRYPYTKEQIKFMVEHGADMTTNELAYALNKTFETNHSAQSVRTVLKRLGVFKSKETRSRINAMKGKPIGSSKIIGGYRYIKVRQSSGGFYQDWKRETQIVYENAYHLGTWL